MLNKKYSNEFKIISRDSEDTNYCVKPIYIDGKGCLKKINTGKSMNDDFRKKNYLNLKPRRRFHKTQIFNNYKPFLVDDFKDYGEYV